MASIEVFFFLFFMICSLYQLHALPANSLGPHLPDIRKLRSCNIDKIYQLGDSISDTGNHIREDPSEPCAKFPYGESLFMEPTGRCSNGLLIIDYIASAAGIPFLNPFMDANGNFTHGANFAVGGSTALSVHTLAEINIVPPGSNSSLGVQLDWMSTHFASHYNSDIDRSLEKFKDSLFFVGEIGGNDYNFALIQGKTIEETKSLVPEVVQAIMNAVRRVIDLGAVKVVVPGDFPIGCFPGFLTQFQSNNPTAYDKHQCLKDLNDFAVFHNEHLQQAISALQEENPNTKIVYADHYNAFKWLLDNAPYLGFDVTSTLQACCGIGGSYSWDSTLICSDPKVPFCSDPDKYISWDGVHLTQKAYRIMAEWLVANILPKFKCDLEIVEKAFLMIY